MLRWFLADLKTGRQILDLPVVDGQWERLLNRPETIGCKVDLNDPDVIALHARNTAAVGKSVLAVAEGDVVLAAGPIWHKRASRDGSMLELAAKGAWSYYDHRHILPLLAATASVKDFTVPNPDESGETIPNPALRTSYSELDLGTIAKRLVEQAHAWTGGSLPVVFQADRDGTHERNYEAGEFRRVGRVLAELQEVQNGPDIRFMPRFTADKLGIEWVLETGTQDEPFLGSSVTHRWDVTAVDSPVSGLEVEEDASGLVDLGWATGGSMNDEVLVSRAYHSALVDLGYPLFEDSTAKSTVVQQRTLDEHAEQLVDLGSAPTETWSFDVETTTQPFLGSYFEGDYCELDLRPYGAPAYTAYGLNSVGDGLWEPGHLTETSPDLYTTNGFSEDPANDGLYEFDTQVAESLTGWSYIPEGGTFRHRIVRISGDARGETVHVECMPRRQS